MQIEENQLNELIKKITVRISQLNSLESITKDEVDLIKNNIRVCYQSCIHSEENLLKIIEFSVPSNILIKKVKELSDILENNIVNEYEKVNQVLFILKYTLYNLNKIEL